MHVLILIKKIYIINEFYIHESHLEQPLDKSIDSP